MHYSVREIKENYMFFQRVFFFFFFRTEKINNNNFDLYGDDIRKETSPAFQK